MKDFRQKSRRLPVSRRLPSTFAELIVKLDSRDVKLQRFTDLFVDNFQPNDGVDELDADATKDRLDGLSEGVQTLEGAADAAFGGGGIVERGGSRRFLFDR